MENTQNQSDGANSSETMKVSIKIPPFWTDKPEIWFYQIEAQFKINNITNEDTKFNYIVAQIETKYIDTIWDIITDDKTENKYSLAKERLLNAFKESESKRIKRLFSGIEIGDMKPSHLLQKMKSLATNDISDMVLKTLWLEKLPQHIKHILAVSDEGIDKLAIMADKIVDMHSQTELYQVNSTDVKNSSTSSNTISQLLEKISSLEQRIEELHFHQQPNGRSRSTERNNRSLSGNKSRSRSRRRYNPNGKLCYYHFTFGSRCFPEKCKPPCSWKNQENLPTQQNQN